MMHKCGKDPIIIIVFEDDADMLHSMLLIHKGSDQMAILLSTLCRVGWSYYVQG